jgi:Na+-translocating ferredoxin:NAD+ oxidoreductase subunit C
MISLPPGVEGKGTFRRGVHPAEHKALAADRAIEVPPTPSSLSVPVLQNVGAPIEPLVQPKQEVAVNEKIGEATAFISAPAHSPVHGTVGRESVVTLPNGRHVQTLSIQPSEGNLEGRALWDDIYGGNWTTAGLDRYDPAEIADKVKEAGIVGQGGAAFPTYVKLLRNEKKPVDTVLVNGCECEPYLTSDHRVMVEAAGAVVTGALLAARAAGAERTIVAIEDNKPDAVEAMRAAAEGAPVQVAVVETKYPMGGEKQTVRAVLGRTIPTGGLPLDVGVVVINVGTASAIARAVLRGKPLTHRVVSVTGAGIRRPNNLLVPIGAPIASLIEYCGGLTEGAVRVLAGGPMMGFALSRLDVPVTKGASGIVALTEEDVARSRETTCVRCGRCVDVCPLNLVPSRLAMASRHHAWERARGDHIQACMECGCCAYVCPASIPLVQLIRMGKAELIKEDRKKSASS